MNQSSVDDFCRGAKASQDQAENSMSFVDGILLNAVDPCKEGAATSFPMEARTDPPQESHAVQTSSEHPKLCTSRSLYVETRKLRFATLRTMKSSESPAGDEDGQTFYAGGSEHGSGQQIVGPRKANKSSDVREIVTSLFTAARQHGAEDVSEEVLANRRRLLAFTGAGHRLGSIAEPLPRATTTSSQTSQSNCHGILKDERIVRLKIWSNGFSVDDGPLRTFDDPQNAEFLNAIREGKVPLELQAVRSEVSIRLEDHHTDEYRPPRITIHAFCGSGQKLDDGTNQTVSSPTVKPFRICVDNALPATQVQIRLPDGSRTTVRCNQSNTLLDVRAHLLAESTDLCNRTFSFASLFPAKPIENEQLTVRDAGLLNAALVVKFC